jgi:hypothetical protein
MQAMVGSTRRAEDHVHASAPLVPTTIQDLAVTTAALALALPLPSSITFGPLRRPLPFPPHRVPAPPQRPAGWPAWLPTPANRPDALAPDAQDELVTERPLAGDGTAPATGGWHDSSLDLLMGLEVRDLGPVQWLDEWDGAFLPN